jgi:hypothetical protein
VQRRAIVRRLGVGIAVTVVTLLASGVPASAASATGYYADWSVGGTSGKYTGSGAPAAAGFPTASITSDATTVKTPAGGSAFLGPATPVGAVYGSSRDMTYMNVSTAKGVTTSTTTLDFDAPTPAANWAFVLGDIDADEVEISATGADGKPVSAADLGFAGTFNYCAVSPKPSGCIGPGPFTDEPTWHPGSSRLVGNGPDTLGSAGWFQPAVPIKSITFKFTALIGIPVYQLWLTTLAVPVETTIGGITPADPVPDPGVVLDLLKPDGVTPIKDAEGKPVEVVADDKGVAVFPAVVDGTYVIKIVPPDRVKSRGKTQIKVTVDVTKGSPKIPQGTFALIVPLQLAVTGADALPATGIGLGLVAFGVLLRTLARRRVAP